MPREQFRNNARLVLAATAGALVLLVGLEVLLRKSRDFSPDFLASVLLYGLTVLNLTLLLVLLFVLGRNLVRVLLERRRGVLGARFRMRLAARLPAHGAWRRRSCSSLVGSDLIQQTVDRWFNVDVERILSSSQALGTALRESVAGAQPRSTPASLAREVERRRPARARGPGPPAPHGGGRARASCTSTSSTSSTREGELPGGDGPAAARSRACDSASGEALAEAALAGREAEATVAVRGGRAGAGGGAGARRPGRAVRGVVMVVDASAGRGGRGGPRGPGALHEVPQGADLQRAHQGRLPLALPLPRAAHPVRRGLALALPRAPHHDSAAPGGGGRRAHRRRRARGAGRLPVRRATSSRALIASFNRMSERLARSEEEVEFNRDRPHPQEPGAGGAAPAHGDGARDGGHRRGGGGRTKARSPR